MFASVGNAYTVVPISSSGAVPQASLAISRSPRSVADDGFNNTICPLDRDAVCASHSDVSGFTAAGISRDPKGLTFREMILQL